SVTCRVRAYSNLASAIRAASSRTSSRSGVTRRAFSAALSASSKSPWRKLASPRSNQRLETGGHSASDGPPAAQPQITADEPMTSTKRAANEATDANERREDLDIDTWGCRGLWPGRKDRTARSEDSGKRGDSPLSPRGRA